MSQPRQLDHPLYALLHNDDVKGFNAKKPKDAEVDLSGGDFRGLDPVSYTHLDVYKRQASARARCGRFPKD